MDQVYKKLEVVGTSKTSIEDAIGNALARVSKADGIMRWFEVAEVRGFVEEGAVSYYQVGLKIGLSLGESDAV
ncbi:MAG TPA: dodecin family protein [Deltaproteobacteria bacterium]|nr:dodecin family protein [Deltaproteobacteria bacterium]HOI06148.1 dodecin family protein [Deltaproteobacteria bacterium]